MRVTIFTETMVTNKNQTIEIALIASLLHRFWIMLDFKCIAVLFIQTTRK